ncbi:hypothetical protein [Litorilituus lipolyticus]|uniref:Uncharacterized protein n=1 Tax=Litorilituus lipolyticus TaxID=2491017 RepID=A0A502KN18_9GAMM|nr:hypothetical protein [Litorilituus lipolyticus]TPH12846.1 hypothetical protein EPA86_15610 [Litorilituus lipolyticus]
MNFWKYFLHLALAPVCSILAVFVCYLVLYGDYSVNVFLLSSITIVTITFLYSTNKAIRLVNDNVNQKANISTAQFVIRLLLVGVFWLLQFLVTLTAWFLKFSS